MIPNKNGKVISATHEEKIDQPRQVFPTELAPKIESPPFCKISEKSETPTCEHRYFSFFMMYFHDISIFRKKTCVPMLASQYNLC